MGVGMPHTLLLQEFGEHVLRAFGHCCYHVGSSLTQKDGWRDVDVRLPIDFQIQQQTHANATENGRRSALFSLCNFVEQEAKP